MKVKSESEVAHSCPTPSDPMDCSLPGSSAHGIFQVRVLEWDAIAFSSKALLIFSSSFVLFLKLNNFNFPFSSALVPLLSIHLVFNPSRKFSTAESLFPFHNSYLFIDMPYLVRHHLHGLFAHVFLKHFSIYKIVGLQSLSSKLEFAV